MSAGNLVEHNVKHFAVAEALAGAGAKVGAVPPDLNSSSICEIRAIRGRYKKARAKKSLSSRKAIPGASNSSGQQFLDRLTLGQNGHRATTQIGERLVVIDVEVSIDRGP